MTIPHSGSEPAAGTSPVVRSLGALDEALDAPRRAGIPLGNWRWVVRQRLVALREVLTQESGTANDGWLAARGGAAFQERNDLLGRLGALGVDVLETPDVERTRTELKRLVADIAGHLERVAPDHTRLRDRP